MLMQISCSNFCTFLAVQFPATFEKNADSLTRCILQNLACRTLFSSSTTTKKMSSSSGSLKCRLVATQTLLSTKNGVCLAPHPMYSTVSRTSHGLKVKGQPHRAEAQACKFRGPTSKNMSLYVCA